MNHQGRTFPRSRSFDPSCLQSQRELHRFRETNMIDSTMFDISSLALQETPDRNMYTHMQLRNVKMTSPLSPISDRSIEPMSVSDISNGDLDRMDTDDDGEESFLNPFGSLKTEKIDDDDQSVKSQASLSRSLLWSNLMKPAEPDFDTRSVMSSKSTGSVLSCQTCRTDQTLTRRKPVLDNASVVSSLPPSLYEKEYIPDRDSSPDISVAQDNIKKKSLCGKCMTALFNLIVLALIVGFVLFLGSKDIQSRICSQSLEFNVEKLQNDLEANVFGQHIAIKTVVDSISELTLNATKNLTVLSFHGWTGIGKNFISGFIAKQMKEDAVHKIIVPLEFAHGQISSDDEERMFVTIKYNIPECGLVLFIVDEVDKASHKAIKVLHKTLKKMATTTDLTNVKVIALLLSNSGGSAINRYFLDQLMKDRYRESIERDEVVDFMLKIDSAQISHEWYIPMLEDNIIDYVVPFLPLERTHTASCVKRYIMETRPQIVPSEIDRIVEHVLEQMAFFPQGMELFSSTGCRGVAMKVDLTID